MKKKSRKPIMSQSGIQGRPREKLLKSGAASLSDAELLSIFLRTGIRGKSAIEIAQEMLEQFGGFRELLEARPENVIKIPGIGIGRCSKWGDD